jgi:glycosyltransferase involved in cell wall biosynthesis
VANSLLGFLGRNNKQDLMENKKKVLFITSSLNLGGAERQLLLLCNVLHDDVEIEIISLDSEGPLIGKYKEHFPNIRLINSPKYSNFVIITKLRHLIKENQPDVVITWLYKADVLGGIAAKLTGNVPVVWSARNSAIPNFNLLKKSTLALLSRIIPSAIVANGHPAFNFHQSIGYPKQKIVLIQNLLSPWTSTVMSKSRLLSSNRKFSDLRIGIAARQVSGKGILETIENISSLPPDFIDIDLTLIGQETPESESWKIKELYKKFHVESKVLDSDIAAWFEELDIYLMPSTSWESQPNSLIEAIAIGCPVIFSNLLELEIEFSGGKSFNPLDSLDFQRAIEEILDQSLDTLTKSTLELRKYILNLTDSKKVKSVWIELILELLRKGNGNLESNRLL